MAAAIIDGDAVARTLRAEVHARVERLRALAFEPGLAVVLVGAEPASLSYVAAKTRACNEVGIRCETIHRPEGTSQAALLDLIENLNRDPRFHGILVQQPLPAQIETSTIVRAIAPEKDVDGLHPENAGLLLLGQPRFIPCTAAGVQQLLTRSGHDPAGKRVVILGRSNLVGKPLAALLAQKREGANATVTVCHSGTSHLASITKDADILVAAVGSPRFVTWEMIGEGAVVIDVGINRVEDPGRRRGYRLVGDVDFEGVLQKASAVSPVPGGVGPMTVAMLLMNVVSAAETSSASPVVPIATGS